MLRDWTELQKYRLLISLRKYGAQDVAKLAAEVPDKTYDEVKMAVHLYERAAISALKDDAKYIPSSRKAPIDGWLDILKQVSMDKHASDDIATAFRLISIYGKHNDTDVVNIRDCYEYIADLMMGKAPKQLNPESMEFIMSCILQMGNLVKDSKTSKEEEFLSKLSLAEIMQKTYGGSKKSSVLRDPALNPLKVPPHLLKMDHNIALPKS